VRCVARHTVRGNHQALFEKGLSVDALRIVLQNVVLVDIPVGLYRSALTVAPAANEWYFQGGDGRILILDREDVVVAVTIDTMGARESPRATALPCSEAACNFLFVAVAGATLDPRQGRRVGQVFALQVRMARGAGKCVVNRRGKPLSVHEQ